MIAGVCAYVQKVICDQVLAKTLEHILCALASKLEAN